MNSSKILRLNIIVLFIFFITTDVFSEILLIDRPLKEGEYIDRKDISEVLFKDGCGILEIPDYAFLGCTGLKKVVLPESLKRIGFQSFSECSELSEINFPESLEDIGSNSFAYCTSLDNLRFPAGLKHIGHNAFSFCESLTEAILPDSIEELESYAFSDCTSLRRVRLPANDNLLGELIMNCCPSLVEIVEPSVKVPKLDCESFIFDPLDEEAYRRCVLVVPEEAAKDYIVSKSWHTFNNIVIGR